MLQVNDRAFCNQLQAPGNLLLAVSLDLATLQNIGTDLRVLDKSEAPLQLVFELTDGCFLTWPSLRTADSSQDLSEAVEKREFGTPDQVIPPFHPAIIIDKFSCWDCLVPSDGLIISLPWIAASSEAYMRKFLTFYKVAHGIRNSKAQILGLL